MWLNNLLFICNKELTFKVSFSYKPLKTTTIEFRHVAYGNTISYSLYKSLKFTFVSTTKCSQTMPQRAPFLGVYWFWTTLLRASCHLFISWLHLPRIWDDSDPLSSRWEFFHWIISRFNWRSRDYLSGSLM